MSDEHEKALRRHIRDQVQVVVVDKFIRAGFKTNLLSASDGWKARLFYPYGNLIRENVEKGEYDIITIQFLNYNYTSVTIYFGKYRSGQLNSLGGISDPQRASAQDLDIFYNLVQSVRMAKCRFSLKGGAFSCSKFLFNETEADADLMIEKLRRCCCQIDDALDADIIGPNVIKFDLTEVNARMRARIQERLNKI
jgi:hypothetical protein